VTKDELKYEKQQLIDEGKDVSGVAKEFDELMEQVERDDSTELRTRMLSFLDKLSALPMRDGYPYHEPSDLEGIRRSRPAGAGEIRMKFDDKMLPDRILGAWLGRCSGCLLGKPVEGIRSEDMWGYLKDLNKYPLREYFRSDVPEEITKKYKIDRTRPFINNVTHMVEDDDLNYTVTALAVMKKHGRDFTPANVADFWMDNIPVNHTCTAEKIAYRNFCNLIKPPLSASFANPYREWIGAQIRTDFYGYIAPGNPELAAEFAFRDACISHTKNGIYGAMWVAAMLSAAPGEDNPGRVIEIGLTQIPVQSRFREGITRVIGWHKEGLGFEEAILRIHRAWDEKQLHHWCHTISNAQLVTVGLLWGEGDFEKSVCRAVQGCLDTDCNGATAGSVVGMMLGAGKLPGKWTGPLNDTLETGLTGYTRVKVSQLAEETHRLLESGRGRNVT